MKGGGNDEARRYRGYLAAERESATVYRALGAATDGERRRALEELAEMEERHAEHWAGKLRELGADVPPPGTERPGLRGRAYVAVARRFGIEAVLPVLERAERSDAGMYDAEPAAAAAMPRDERMHARVLARLREGRATPVIGHAEPWHRGDRSGVLRAAVFGVNDGLVSNTALVMGFAGSGAPAGTILLAGLAGLLAGAFSMAAGEYVSMASQRESFERELGLEEAELRDKPEEEERELALIYQAKGLDPEAAAATAAQIMRDRATALDTLAREELGLDPSELGSPWGAAASSFVMFALGALVVVIPYLFGSGLAALVVAIGLAALALVGVGAGIGALTGRPPLRAALRQLLVGTVAAGATYGFGSLIGVSVAG